ncbi:ABC transporter permease [Mesotoga prima]|uniref:ABC transporter permease n=1 Tax=Mesotoga prima TaxID=1184387 RepID=UPI002FE2912E
MLIQILSLFIGISTVVIVVSMFFNPVIFKIGFRNIFRRRTDTLLVIMGSLIGTALIVGSMAMNDSFQKFLYNQIERGNGEVDQFVYIPSANRNIGKEFISNDKISKLVEHLLDDSKVDGVLPVLSRSVTVGFPGETRVQSGKSVQVSLLGVDSELIYAWPDASNKIKPSVFDTADGELVAIINEELAASLNAAVGDTLEILADPGQRLLFWIELPKVRIADIVKGNGLLYYQIESQMANGFTLILPVESARTLLKINVPELFNGLLVSNRGNFIEGERLTDAVVASIESIAGNEFRIDTVKKNAISRADQGNIGLLFLVLSVFAIFAGTLLLSNIYLMLAQERRTELGTLRAIGYSRRRVSKTIVYEGFFYSIISSAIGVLAGLAIAGFIFGSFVNLFTDIATLIPFENAATAFRSIQSSFAFYVRPESVFYGFLLGLIIPMIIVLLTGKKIARTNIVKAVRNIPEELDKKQRLFLNILAGAGVLISIIMAYSGYSIRNATLFFIGVVVTGLLFPVSIPLKNKKILESLFSVGVIVFTMLSNSFSLIADNSTSSIYLVVAKGGAILFAGLFLIVYNLKTFELILNKVFQRARSAAPVFKISIAFSARNLVRTGLTIAMYGVVIFVITLISIIPYSQEQMFIKSRDMIFAGYDVGIFSISGRTVLSFTEVQSLGQVSEVTSVENISVALREDGRYIRESLYGIDNSFVVNNKFFEIEYDRSLGLSSGKQVWEYLKLNPGTVVVSSNVLPGVVPGDFIELRKILEGESTSQGPPAGFIRRSLSEDLIGSDSFVFRVIATLPENTISFMNGIFVYREHLPSSLDGNVASRNYLVNLSGTNQVEKKENFRALNEYVGAGSVVTLYVDDIIELTSTILKGTISILRSFLYFGMLVGIVGIAIIMFKALYERKRIVGMLKAIGFTKKMVFASFVLETTFIVFIGIVLGIITGTLTSVEIYASPEMQGMRLYIPWDQLVGMSLIFYLASLVFTIIPSYMASKIPPAEALRYFE